MRRKASLRPRIELTDFSVYYSQGAAEAAIAAMKEGKSEVMCKQGQLYKVIKSLSNASPSAQISNMAFAAPIIPKAREGFPLVPEV
jgi:hypothetical protein